MEASTVPRLVPLPAGLLEPAPHRACSVLLDLDGTLLDSNDAHANAWYDAIVDAGYPAVPLERLRSLVGVGADKLLPVVLGIARQDSEWRRITSLRRALFRDRYLDTLRPFPDVRRLLQLLQDAGWRCVIATAAASEEVDGLLERAKVGDLVQEVVRATHYMPSKPDPDLFELALRRVRCRRDEAMVLGDTPYDLMAASRARLRAVALRSGGWPDEALHSAIAIYDDPRDLVHRFRDSPFATALPGFMGDLRPATTH